MRYDLHPDVLVLPRADGSACLVHLGGSCYVVDAATFGDLNQLLSSARGADAPRGHLLDELRRARLIRPRHGRPDRTTAHVAGFMAFVLGSARPLLVDPYPAAPLLLAEAKLAVATLGWATAVGVWERTFPQPAPGQRPSPGGRSAQELGNAVRRAGARWERWYQCKERALATLALIRSSSQPADLVLGVRHLPLAAHVWVEVAGIVVGDDPERIWQYEPVARYTGSGQPASP